MKNHPNYPYRKHPRLPLENYSNPAQAFSITICTKERKRIFVCSSFADEVYKTLGGWLAKRCILIAASILPDHVHLLLASKEFDLPTLIATWKRHINMIAARYGLSRPLWQNSFYDHGVRQEEGLSRVADYILANPVRLQLCARWDEYPYNYLAR
jgi:putative transposase